MSAFAFSLSCLLIRRSRSNISFRALIFSWLVSCSFSLYASILSIKTLRSFSFSVWSFFISCIFWNCSLFLRALNFFRSCINCYSFRVLSSFNCIFSVSIFCLVRPSSFLLCWVNLSIKTFLWFNWSIRSFYISFILWSLDWAKTSVMICFFCVLYHFRPAASCCFFASVFCLINLASISFCSFCSNFFCLLFVNFSSCLNYC